MKYLNVYETHDAYSSAKSGLPKPSVSYDTDHVHYLPTPSGLLVLYDKYGTTLLYSKKITDGYSDNVTLTLADLGGATRLGGPFVVYDDDMSFQFRVYVPYDETEGSSFKITSNSEDDDENFDVTEDVLEDYGGLASYVGRRVSLGVEIKLKHTVTYNGVVYTYSSASTEVGGTTYYTCNNSSADPDQIRVTVNPEKQEDGVITTTVYTFSNDTGFVALATTEVTFATIEVVNADDDK